MVVDHLSTFVNGGAGLAALRLHKRLRENGIRSRFWSTQTLPPEKGIDETHVLRWQTATYKDHLGLPIRALQKPWFKWRYLHGRPAGFEMFSFPTLVRPTRLDPNVLSGEILHLHWVAKALDYASFFGSVPDDRPIVWTLHDMNPLTGGCHFATGCERFTAACGHCPQLRHAADNDISTRYFALKREAVRGKSLHVVAPSRWLLREAKRSPVFRDAKSFHHIPYGLEVDTLSAHENHIAREQLGLPQNRFIIGCGSDNLNNPRKGGRELIAALRQLEPAQPVLVLMFGGGRLKEDIGLPEVKSLGYLRDTQQLSLAYLAMDVFVMPSLEDNLPQTGLEAMACGTPVVAFDVGGVPDYVRPGKTGWLAQRGDVADLSRTIAEAVAHSDQMAPMGAQARSMVLEEFHTDREVRQYLALYQELLSDWAKTKKVA